MRGLCKLGCVAAGLAVAGLLPARAAWIYDGESGAWEDMPDYVAAGFAGLHESNAVLRAMVETNAASIASNMEAVGVVQTGKQDYAANLGEWSGVGTNAYRDLLEALWDADDAALPRGGGIEFVLAGDWRYADGKGATTNNNVYPICTDTVLNGTNYWGIGLGRDGANLHDGYYWVVAADAPGAHTNSFRYFGLTYTNPALNKCRLVGDESGTGTIYDSGDLIVTALTNWHSVGVVYTNTSHQTFWRAYFYAQLTNSLYMDPNFGRAQ